MAEFVTLAIFDEMHWADFAANALEEAGIYRFVLNKYQVGVRPSHPFLNLELRVPEPLAGEAAALLREIFPRPFPGQFLWALPDEYLPEKSMRPCCPACGHDRAAPVSGRLRALLEIYLAFIVVSTRKVRLRCKNCGEIWLP